MPAGADPAEAENPAEAEDPADNTATVVEPDQEPDVVPDSGVPDVVPDQALDSTLGAGLYCGALGWHTSLAHLF